MDYQLIEYMDDGVLGRIMPNGEWVAYTPEELSELTLVARAECTALADKVIDWIPIDDKMPADCTDVICRCVGIHPFVDMLYRSNGVWWKCGHEVFPLDVTHYQPLPIPVI